MNEFQLEPDEKIIVQARKSWLLFLIELLPYAIIAIIPFVFAYMLAATPSAPTINFGAPITRAILGIWLLITWTSAWGIYTRYFLNAWVLTNQRVVDIKQRAFFNREVSSLFLSRVQDVTSDMDGFLFSICNVGNINVQSAGEEERFSMHGIPHPDQMRDLILKYISTDSKPGSGVE